MARRRSTKAAASQPAIEPIATVGGRPVRWDAWDLEGLDPEDRLRAGRSWASRMKQEHLAVGAFAILVGEVAAEGCDPVVLALLARAASDEVRHTEICRRMAVGLLGEEAVPGRLRGVPSIPKHTDATPESRSLLHVVEMCCLSETFTGVYLTEMLARMDSGTPRMAVESLLEDEIDHGRVGWAFLASRARDRRADGLAAEVPAMLDRTMGWVMDAGRAQPEPETRALESVGYLGSSASASIFRKALTEVILPGFEACGVDAGLARGHAQSRGWL